MKAHTIQENEYEEIGYETPAPQDEDYVSATGEDLPNLNRHIVLQATVRMPKQKVARQLISQIKQHKISTSHQNGLYAYVALKSRAMDYPIADTQANLILRKCDLFWLLRVKRQKEITRLLNLLSKKKLLSWWMDPVTNEYMITFFEDVKKTPKEQKQLASCASDRTGYFFIQKDVVRQFFSSKFSEADILVDLWLNTVYREPDNSMTCSCPMVIFNTQGYQIGCHRFHWLALRYGYSRSGIYALLHRLQADNFLSIRSLLGRGTLLFMPMFSEMLFKEKSQPYRADLFKGDKFWRMMISSLTKRMQNSGRLGEMYNEWSVKMGYC